MEFCDIQAFYCEIILHSHVGKYSLSSAMLNPHREDVGKLNKI